jgi:hypothetical protein
VYRGLSKQFFGPREWSGRRDETEALIRAIQTLSISALLCYLETEEAQILIIPIKSRPTASSTSFN